MENSILYAKIAAGFILLQAYKKFTLFMTILAKKL